MFSQEWNLSFWVPNLVVYILNYTASSARWEYNPGTLYKQNGPQITFWLVKLIEVYQVWKH